MGTIPDTLYVTIFGVGVSEPMTGVAPRGQKALPQLGPQAEWLRHSFCPPHGAYDSFLPFRAFGNCVGGVNSDEL